jgi:hypothetical protein
MIGTAPMTTHIKKNRRRKRPLEEGFMEVPFDWRAEKEGTGRRSVGRPGNRSLPDGQLSRGDQHHLLVCEPLASRWCGWMAMINTGRTVFRTGAILTPPFQRPINTCGP